MSSAAPSTMQNQDPVAAPLRVVAVGLVLTIATVFFGSVMFFLIERDVPVAPFSRLLSVFSVASDITVIVGCVMVSRAKRPGASQALIAAVCHGVDVLFTGLWMLLPLVASATALFTMMGLGNALVDIVGVVLIAMSLRELARSRGRNFDGWLIGASVVAGLTLLARLGEVLFNYPFAIYIGTSVISVATRVVLVIVTLALAKTSTLPDAQLAHDSAYRGPTGAITTQVEGSLALGFLAGFFGGCIGACLVLALAKGPLTKRGAGIGFACQTVVGIILRVALQ